MNNKRFIKNTIVAIEKRINQLFDMIQANPSNTELDHVLVQHIDRLNGLCDTYLDMDDE